MAKNLYEVVVGNIGAAHTGNNKKEAIKDYHAYVAISKNGPGRASGESVTLFKNGEPIREYVGRRDE